MPASYLLSECARRGPLAATSVHGALSLNVPLQDVDVFDIHCFHMNKGEALALDPQARLLLHVTCEALQDSGSSFDLESMGSRTSTYVGCMFMDYMNMLRVGLEMKHSGPVMTGRRLALFHLRAIEVTVQPPNESPCFMLRRKWRAISVWPRGVYVWPPGALQRHRHCLLE